jgi:hypothetical protein
MKTNAATSEQPASNPTPTTPTTLTTPTTPTAPTKLMRKRGVIAALAALACLTSVMGAVALDSSASPTQAKQSASDGRAKPKTKKTGRHTPKTTAVRVPKKKRTKPKTAQFQAVENGNDGQDASNGEDGIDNLENCEYDETNDEYWCDEESTSIQPATEGATTTEGVYKINGNEVDTNGASPATAKAVTAAWKHFATLIPQDRRTMITTFSLIDKNETEYDGQVEETDSKNHTWALRLKAGKDADDFVVVHEFGHLLTLSPQQLDSSVSKRNCQTYRFWEGCPRTTSFSGRFIDRFWTPDMVRQTEANHKRFEKRNPGAFVRDYAATNPGEDLADTFAEFVTAAKQPTGNRIVDQKINMFWADPDMMFLRTQIRANGKL